MTRYRIAFHVMVEVDAPDELDAVHRVNIACGWPAHTTPPMGAWTKTADHPHAGEVSADVLYARALLIKELP